MKRNLALALLFTPATAFYWGCSDDAGSAPGPDGGVDDATVEAGPVGNEAGGRDGDTTADASDAGTTSDAADAAPDVACVEEAGSPFLDDAIDLGVGYQHACAVRSNGHVFCWGAWGGGTGEHAFNGADGGPVVMRRVRSGREFSCGLDDEGQVWCIGHNANGVVGQPPASTFLEPRLVHTGNGAVLTATDVGAAFQTACAISGGRVLCWGENAAGQLGDAGDGGPTNVPTDIGIAVSSQARLEGSPNNGNLCVRDGNNVTCWGANNVGQLGVPASPSDLVAGEAQVLTDAGGTLPIADLSAGYRTCMVDGTKSVYCWGYCLTECGPGGVVGPTPTRVSGLDGGATRVSTGSDWTCVVDQSEGAQCFGRNYIQALGRGPDASANDDPNPAPVVGADGGPIRGVTDVQSGGIFSCATLKNGCGTASPAHVVCWGFNGGTGVLGDKDAGTMSGVPVRVVVK